MVLKIQPLRPYMMFTDSKGNLTKDAYDFLYAMFLRVGGSLDSLNAATLQAQTWEEPGQIGFTTPSFGKFNNLTSTLTYISKGTASFEGPVSFTSDFNWTSNGHFTVQPTLYVGKMDNIDLGTLSPAVGYFSVLKSNAGFGCNGKAPQTSQALPNLATDLASTMTLVNSIRTALVNNGIGA